MKRRSGLAAPRRVQGFSPCNIRLLLMASSVLMLTDVPVRAYGLGTSMACLFGRKSWILSACPTGDQGNLEKGPHLISTIQLRNVPHLTASVRLNSRAACDLEISRKKRAASACRLGQAATRQETYRVKQRSTRRATGTRYKIRGMRQRTD